MRRGIDDRKDIYFLRYAHTKRFNVITILHLSRLLSTAEFAHVVELRTVWANAIVRIIFCRETYCVPEGRVTYSF